MTAPQESGHNPRPDRVQVTGQHIQTLGVIPEAALHRAMIWTQ